MKDWLRVIGFVLIVIALGIAYGLISGPANAQETEPTYYLKLDLGAGFPTDTSNDDPVEYNEHPSPLILGAYGIDWKYVAAEIEGGYRYTPTPAPAQPLSRSASASSPKRTKATATAT